jgi:hypothetical protein
MRERLDRIAGVREMPRRARGTGSASARVLFGDCASHGSLTEVVGNDPVLQMKALRRTLVSAWPIKIMSV